MKSLIKTAIVSAGFILAAQAYATSFKFENELSTDTVNIRYNDSAKISTNLSDKVSATFESEKVELHAEVEYTIDQDDDGYFKGTLSDCDYSVVFNPLNFLSLGWHSKFETAGACLPVYDDTLESGCLGSSGFTVVALPFDGLRISVSLPMDENDNFFFNPSQNKINMAFGADYCFKDLLTVGAVARNVFNSDLITVGAYVNVTPFEDFFVAAGYTYAAASVGFEDLSISEEAGVTGKNLLNFAVSKAFDNFTVTAEGLFNLVNADSDYDIYTALCGEYAFNDNWGVNAAVKMLFDVTENGLKPVIGGKLNGAYTFNDNHNIEVGVKVEAVDNTVLFAVPITYKFSLGQ